MDGENHAKNPPLLLSGVGKAKLVVDIAFKQDDLAIRALSASSGQRATKHTTTILFFRLLFGDGDAAIVGRGAIRASIRVPRGIERLRLLLLLGSLSYGRRHRSSAEDLPRSWVLRGDGRGREVERARGKGTALKSKETGESKEKQGKPDLHHRQSVTDERVLMLESFPRHLAERLSGNDAVRFEIGPAARTASRPKYYCITEGLDLLLGGAEALPGSGRPADSSWVSESENPMPAYPSSPLCESPQTVM